MSFLQTVRVAVRALLRNKMRAFLTTLGVVIGVGAVIAMVAIGEGAKARVEQSFASMGSNLIIVRSGSSSMGGVRGGFGSQLTLTWDDLQAVATELASVRYVAPVLQSRAQVVAAEENWSTSVTGTSVDYFAIRSWTVAQGTLFSQSDVVGAAKVVVLGRTVVTSLYGADYDPVGEIVRINNVPFTVQGVLATKGQSPMGQDYDDAVFIPHTTFQSRIEGGSQQYIRGSMFVGADPVRGTTRAEADLRALLRQRHRLAPDVEDDFSIRNLAEMANATQEGAKTLSTLLAAIAAVSLLVGGIGIMNIMLVSVTERTREIGLRMAVGARPRDILVQFLIEALALSTTGGLIGIALGLGGAAALASQFGWSMLIRPDIVVLSVLFSGAVGIGFGLYPARRASQLDPIDALRYE